MSNNHQPNPDALQQDSLNITQLELFIELKGFKPLSEKEIHKGKTHLRIYGTQDPMPWNTIYTRLSSGQPIAEVGKQYGHIRKLALWAQLENITLNHQQAAIIEAETAVRQSIVTVANDDPDTAMTLLQRMNEVAPDFQTRVAQVADKAIRKIDAKLDDKFLEAQDISHLMNAFQKLTDTVGETQRHSSAININNNHLNIPEGFSIVEAVPPDGFDPEAILSDANHDIDALEALTDEDKPLDDVTPLEPVTKVEKDG